MGNTLVYQALMGTYRRLLGSEGPNGSFSLAQDLEQAKKMVLVPERELENLIFARSFLRGLRARYPSASIAVVTTGEYSSVLEGEYWTNHLFFITRDRKIHSTNP